MALGSMALKWLAKSRTQNNFPILFLHRHSRLRQTASQAGEKATICMRAWD